MAANYKRNLLIAAGAATVLGGISLVSAGLVHAATTTGPHAELVETLASKFHLNRDEVQAVFSEHHTKLRAKHEQHYTDRLQQAVDQGTLTVEQRDKIIVKHKELMANHEARKESMKDKTLQERKIAREQERQELEAWAKDNNIPVKFLMPPGHIAKHAPEVHIQER